MASNKPTAKQDPAASKRAPKLGQIERTTNAVMDAVLELLKDHSYRDLSIDLIAEHSGIARSTIYRRWGSVAQLAIDAFEQALGPGLPSPDHGDVRTDLVHLYHRFAKILRSSLWGRVLPSLIEASATDADFRALLSRLDDERRINGRTIIRRAVERGELGTDANPEWIIDTLSGLIYHRYLITDTELNEEGLIEWAVDSCLAGHMR